MRGNVGIISALKAASAKLTRIPKRIFLIDRRDRLSVVQAYALGATHVLADSVNQAQLLAKLFDSDVAAIASDQTVSGGLEAASAAAASIASMFAAVVSGTPIDIRSAKSAGSRMAERV